MNFATSSSSITLNSMLEVYREFARRHPPSSIAVSVRCNREFIAKTVEYANRNSMQVGNLATSNPELILLGMKIIEDEGVPPNAYYVKYADGHEEMVTPFGTFSREAQSK